jgi:Ca2+-binding RTX toxin-like protein
LKEIAMALDANEQYLLELINRARLDPLGEAGRYGLADLNRNLPAGTITGLPLQVLAPNELLNNAAAAHSQWMLSTDIFSHTGVDGTSPKDRMTAAGYTFSGSWAAGENISWTGSFPTSPDLTAAIDAQHQGLFLSDGHRANILDGFFREIGLGQEAGQFLYQGTNWNASMITEKFATSGSNVFITGVAYTDTNGNKFYTVGEAVGGVSVSISGGASTTTSAAGGYALGTSAGVKTVTFGSGTIQVDASAGNAKLDLVNNNAFYVSTNATLVSGVNALVLLGAAAINGSGNGNANTLTGNKASNVLTGGAGNDLLTGGLGNDSIDGGNDTDTAIFTGNRNTYTVTQNLNGSWTVVGADGTDTLTNVEFGQFSDITIALGGGVNPFDGNGNDNLIDGDGGNNTINGFGGNDTLNGNDGNDVVNGGDNNDTITGGNGNDTLNGDNGNDSFDGGAGNDRMTGGLGNDTYNNVATGDTIIEASNGGSDTVRTALNTYTLPANVERVDFIGVGNFVGTGNSGHNRFTGGSNDDRFIDVAGGNDTMSGGGGSDSVDFRSSATGTTINLLTGTHGGAAAGDFYASIEKFFGSNTAGDSMTGGVGRANFSGFGGNDTLTGGNNIDALQGNAGNDVLSGLGGVDSLDGGAGNDTMTGGLGAKDYFVYSAAGFGQDRITDFEDNLDKLKVHSSVATSIAAFSIAGNGSTNVVLTQISSPTNTITLQGASAITITAADFLFY